MKTLEVRVARHNANALAVAEWLEADPRVSRVLYPGLPSHPDHDIAKAQMRGFGGMVTFDLAGDYDRAARFFDRIDVFKRATSLGGVESLCSLPVLTSQFGWTDEQMARADVTRGMVRLSVGLEDPSDLIARPRSGAQLIFVATSLGSRCSFAGTSLGVASLASRDSLAVSFLRSAGSGDVAQEGRGHLAQAQRDVRVAQVAVLLDEALPRHDGLGHRAVTAGAADVAEPALHELAGVPRVAEVAHRDDRVSLTRPATIVHFVSSSCR